MSDTLFCDHCGRAIPRGTSFYKYEYNQQSFCCKKCFNDHLWHGKDETCYCDRVNPDYPLSYSDLYDYYLNFQNSRG